MNDSNGIKIGLLGCGTVGGSLVNLLAERESELMRTTGLRFQITMIGVRNISRVKLPADSQIEVTTDTAALVKNDAIDIVVELIGGIEPARDLVLAALNAGKPVITANKELLAESGLELYQTASANGVDVLFEASAAGAIPIVRPLRESLLGEDIKRVMGIVNGTTNYILSQMSDEGQSYADALSQAQQLGYAESDPTADVEGYDAGAKAAIMASLAFGSYVVSSNVTHEGISSVTKEDIAFADELGYVIKLLALAEKFDDGEIGVRVFPALVEKKHPLASVRGSYNAVFLEGEASSELMFYGRGAGGLPTASAVLGDLVDAALNLKRGMHRPVIHGDKAVIKPASQMKSSFFFVIDAKNSPGVLSAIAGYFSDQNISIKAMEQEPLADDGTFARMVFLTEEALDENATAVIKLCESSDYVDQVKSFFRVLR